VTVSYDELLNKNNTQGIYLKRISKANINTVKQNRTKDENFNIEKKTLLIRNGSNPKIWFTGDSSQPILMAYESPDPTGNGSSNSLKIM
jgi:hypothetical protein